MFHRATKSLAKQLDPDGCFIPIRCPVDENHFRPLCLVQRKRKNPWWQSNPYHKTEYRLHDILLLGDHTARLVVQDSVPVTIVDKVDGTMHGSIRGAVDLATITLMGLSNTTQSRSVKVKKTSISPSKLHCITKERKVNMGHGFIKQSKAFKRDLYVVTEAIETVEETQFEEFSKTEGSIFSENYIKVKLNSARDSKKAIIIPKDCVLAFRAKQLQIEEGSLEISDYSSNKTATFGTPLVVCGGKRAWPSVRSTGSSPHRGYRSADGDYRALLKLCARLPPPPPPPLPASSIKCGSTLQPKASDMQTDDAELVVPGDKRKNLQKEVKEECKDLSCLSADLRGTFLRGFVAIMRKNDLLYELESQLEEALDSQSGLKADRPEFQELVENLQDSSGALVTHLAESVLYFLEALNELAEFQLLLLAESVEKKIVSKQLALVESILDQGSSDKEWKFDVGAQTVSEEDQNITRAMIEISGVTVEKNGSCLAGSGNPAAFSALGALYVALYALNLLLAS